MEDLKTRILRTMLTTPTDGRTSVEDTVKLADSAMVAIDEHNLECARYSERGLGHEAGHVWANTMLGVLRDESETQAARISVCKQLLALGWRSR